jgi:hypothetical protein
MKWKAMLLLLDGALVIAFLAILLMPLAALGPDFFGAFWQRTWPVAAAFLVVLGVVNGWFLANRRLLSLLASGDWPALAAVLEERVFHGRFAGAMHVGILTNAYLATSNTDGLLALEAFLSDKHPRLVARFALAFGIPRLVGGDCAAAEAHFAGLLARAGLRDRDWLRWDRAFCLAQLGRREEAQAELLALAAGVRDPVLTMLSLYLLDLYGRFDDTVRERVEQGRSRLVSRMPAARMRRRLEQGAGNVQVAVLSRLAGEAERWLYAVEPT